MHAHPEGPTIAHNSVSKRPSGEKRSEVIHGDSQYGCGRLVVKYRAHGKIPVPITVRPLHRGLAWQNIVLETGIRMPL